MVSTAPPAAQKPTAQDQECSDNVQKCAEVYSQCVQDGGSDIDEICSCMGSFNACVRWPDSCRSSNISESLVDALDQACKQFEQAAGRNCCVEEDVPYSRGLTTGAKIAIGLTFAALFVLLVIGLFVRSLNNLEPYRT